MIVLGFDTSTSATAVALRLDDGLTTLARDDPPADAHPGHATRLLEMVHDLLMQAELAWSDIDRIAVGVGPGTFTGLRVGVATARGLAQSLNAELVAVSSLRALAAAALAEEPAGSGRQEPGAVLAVIDARRGEAFVAAYENGDDGYPRELTPARAVSPAALTDVLATAERTLDCPGRPDDRVGQAFDGAEHAIAPAERTWLAVGDGALRYRDQLTGAGARVPADDSPLHLVSGAAICELGVRSAALGVGEIEPDYRRRPDAELALERAGATSDRIAR